MMCDDDGTFPVVSRERRGVNDDDLAW